MEDWKEILEDSQRCGDFKSLLASSLTPQITRYLPISMGFSDVDSDIEHWISDRTDEAQVLTIHCRTTGSFAGLIFLHEGMEEEVIAQVYVGYFLREECWGKGFATEAMRALVAAFRKQPPLRLLAGVDKTNRASANVLRKSGFTPVPEQTTNTRECYECRIM